MAGVETAAPGDILPAQESATFLSAQKNPNPLVGARTVEYTGLKELTSLQRSRNVSAQS